jgi:hypothetical protein
MEGIKKPHMDKCKDIMNEWNYDARCTPTSLLVWDLENFKCLIFVAQSVQLCSAYFYTFNGGGVCVCVCAHVDCVLNSLI